MKFPKAFIPILANHAMIQLLVLELEDDNDDE